MCDAGAWFNTALHVVGKHGFIDEGNSSGGVDGKDV